VSSFGIERILVQNDLSLPRHSGKGRSVRQIMPMQPDAHYPSQLRFTRVPHRFVCRWPQLPAGRTTHGTFHSRDAWPILGDTI
jgi:hypothetical protein